MVSIRSEITPKDNMASKQTKTPRQGKQGKRGKVALPAANKPGRQPTIDVARALELRLKNNLSYGAIGEIMGVSKQAVQKRLSTFTQLLSDPEIDKAYDNAKAEVMTGVERRMLEMIVDPARLEKASVNNIAYAFDKVFQANRLVQGKSTVNQQSIQYILSQIEYEDKTSGKHPPQIAPQVGSQTHPDNTTLISVDQT